MRSATPPSPLWNGIVAFFTDAFAVFTGFWSNTWDGIVNTFQTIWGKITGIANSIWDGVKRVFKDGVNAVIDGINWLTDKVNVVLRFLLIPEIPRVPRLEAGGIVGQPQMLAAGGRIGGGFITNGPTAIVGEGRQRYPEYVVPTDPAYRARAMSLYGSLGSQLGADRMSPTLLADGGILDGIGSWIGNTAGTVWRGVTSAASAVAGALGDAAQWFGGGVQGLIDSTLGAIRGMLPGGLIGDMGVGIAHKTLDGIKTKIDEFMASQAGGGGGGVAVPPGPIMAILQATAAQFGWGSGPQFAALLQLVQHESGFDPNAQNRTSTAYGLFQFLNSTWASTGIAKTSNPSLQALAGMRYIQNSYGSPANAWTKWQSRSPHWYDQGGLASGSGFMMKQTLRPERVLAPRDTAAFEQLVGALRSGRPQARLGDLAALEQVAASQTVRRGVPLTGFPGEPALISGGVHIQAPQGATGEDVARVVTRELRVAKHGGRYRR